MSGNPAAPFISALLNGLPLGDPTLIVDVGANPVEEPPYNALLDAGGCRVVGFEPHPQAFDELTSQNLPNRSYLPHAVGNGASVDFNVYKASGLSSVFKPYDGAFRFLGRSRNNMSLISETRMPTVRLDDLFETQGMHLLKIDIQGGEVAVFDGAAARLSDAVAVIVETRFYQLYEGEPMLGGVDTALRNLGFQLHKFLFEKARVLPSRWKDRLKLREHRNQLIDGDAVYIKDPGALSGLSSDQLAHLALLAGSVFDSHDLALWCIDQLAQAHGVNPSLGDAYLDALPAHLKK